MSIKNFSFILMACVTGCLPAGKISSTLSRIQKITHSPGFSIGVAFKDLQTGETILINEQENFHAASTMKTAVLVELYKQAAAGKFSLRDSVTVRNSFTSIADGSTYVLKPADDSEKSLYQETGKKETLYNLGYAMIVKSSNLATNVLMQLLGAENIMTTMKQVGANDTRIVRGVEDVKAHELGMNNSTTAYDLMLVFEKMALGQLVDQGSCEAMINILLDQQFNEIIPARLPKAVAVAHKTGSISTCRHDSGIIFLPDGKKYVLALLSRFQPGTQIQAEKKLAEISRLLYKHVISR